MTDKIKDIINNFSDMKIIKALECCIIGDCDNCPFYETRELCPNLILFVSDLIKRQEAEVEKLKSKNSNLTSDLSSLRNDLSSAKAEIEMDDVEIKELRIALQGYLDDLTKERNLYKKSIEELNQAKAEIEALINGQETLQKYIAEKDAEIERLEDKIKKAKDKVIETIPLVEEDIKTAKAEAYREFAELLKQQKYQSSDWSHGEHPYVVEESDIDNTLNDLVGDENESTN